MSDRADVMDNKNKRVRSKKKKKNGALGLTYGGKTERSMGVTELTGSTPFPAGLKSFQRRAP